MKHFIILVFILGFLGGLLAQPTGIDSVKNQRILIGKVSQANIADSIWYRVNYSEAVVSEVQVETLDKLNANFNVEIYFGSWCDDSQFWVPAFIGLMDKTAYAEKIQLIAVNRSKKSKDTAKLKEIIDKVPTFVVWCDGKEVGRIVESPEESLVEDLTKILVMSECSK